MPSEELSRFLRAPSPESQRGHPLPPEGKSFFSLPSSNVDDVVRPSLESRSGRSRGSVRSSRGKSGDHHRSCVYATNGDGRQPPEDRTDPRLRPGLLLSRWRTTSSTRCSRPIPALLGGEGLRAELSYGRFWREGKESLVGQNELPFILSPSWSERRRKRGSLLPSEELSRFLRAPSPESQRGHSFPRKGKASFPFHRAT